MAEALAGQISTPSGLRRAGSFAVVSGGRKLRLCLPIRRNFCSLTIRSSTEDAPSDHFTSTVGSPVAFQPARWAVTQRHVEFLSYAGFAVAISATCCFCYAIPTLLAFKKAAESMEKLMDATREELPSTMAALRLSGMEISDLTMELSDISQGITQGVRSSTNGIRLAEKKLRQMINMNSTGVGAQGNS